MKNILAFLYAMTTLLILTQCKENKTVSPPKTITQQNDSVISVPDSTIYGVALESGMSTLCIRTTAGDTLVMDKDDEKGYGDFYGYVEEEDSFAVTKREGSEGPVVVKAYNLTLLKRFSTEYAIRNGILVLKNDTVDIKSINDDSLVVESHIKKTKQTLYPIKK